MHGGPIFFLLARDKVKMKNLLQGIQRAWNQYTGKKCIQTVHLYIFSFMFPPKDFTIYSSWSGIQFIKYI